MSDDTRHTTNLPEPEPQPGTPSRRRRLKITSEGHLRGSKAIDLDTGETIPFREARISIAADRGVEIELLVAGCVEIEGRGLVRSVCPECLQQKGQPYRAIREEKAEVER